MKWWTFSLFPQTVVRHGYGHIPHSSVKFIISPPITDGSFSVSGTSGKTYSPSAADWEGKKNHFQLCTSKSINNFQHLSIIGMQIWEYRYTSTLEGNFHYKRLKTAAESDHNAHSLLPQCLCCRPSAASGRGLTFRGSTNVPVHRPSHSLLPPCEAAVALCNSKSLYSLCVHSMVCMCCVCACFLAYY